MDLEDTRTEPSRPGEPRRASGRATDGLEAGRMGRYVILRELGSGSSGTVLSGYDEHLGRRVAIKVLHAWASADERARKRVLREAQAMARLSHPSVAHVYEAGEDDGRVYLVMEFVDGATLGRWLQGSRDWREIVEVFILAGQGLAAAHAAGLIHRDFKPSNVMVEGGDTTTVKVLDFGLARAQQADPSLATATRATADMDSSLGASSTEGILLDAELTQQGLAMGTPAYMSPEQFKGGTLDAATDQFSFCVALWEAVHGRRPFAGRTARERLSAIRRGLEHLPRDKKVPSWLRSVIARGLSEDPADRWRSMPALLEALGRGAGLRRRRLAASLAVVGTLAVAGGTVGVWAMQPDTCRGSDDMNMQWAVERAKVADHFEGLDTKLGLETADLAQARLQKWVDEWQRGHERACRAERGSEASESEIRERATCLRHRRTQFDNLVAHLTELDRNSVASALAAVDVLPLPSDCDDLERLRRRAPRPDDADQAVEVRVIRDEVLRLRMRGGAHLDATDALMKRAERVGFPAVLAEVEELRGAQLSASERAAEIGVYRRALMRALEEEHLVLAASVARKLALSLLAEERLAEAKLLVDLALSLDRAADDPNRISDTLSVRARLEEAQGRDEAAEATYRQALGVLGATPHTAATTTAQNFFGFFLLEHGRVEEAMPLLQENYQQRVASRGRYHPDTAMALANLSAARLAVGEVDRAKRGYEEVLDVMTEFHGPQSPALFPPIYELARIHGMQGELQLAIDKGRGALRQTEGLSPGHDWWRKARVTLMTHLFDAGAYDEVLEIVDPALVAMQAADVPAFESTEVWVLRMQTLVATGQRYSETEFVQRCSGSQVSDETAGLCHTRKALGHRARGDHEGAVSAWRACLDVTAGGDKNTASLRATCTVNLAESLDEVERVAEALPDLGAIDASSFAAPLDRGRFHFMTAKARHAHADFEGARRTAALAVAAFDEANEQERASLVTAWLEQLRE